MRTVWEPQQKQREFLERSEDEVFYGGAAGGGKSDALINEALRQVKIPNYKGIIFRKTFPELEEIILRSEILYPQAFPGCNYNSSKHVWKFPSGARIYFGSMPHQGQYTHYQGRSFDFIGFDELTHFGWDEYSYLFSRNRPSGPNTQVYMRATGNPGGPGHGWVKSRFITAAPPKRVIWEKREVFKPNGEILKLWKSRVFIPSSVFDNKKLMENDPNYIANLAMLPEAKRNALLYGDWDSFSGQVFREWRDDPAGYKTRKNSHVIDPFPIPDHWKIIRGFDFGYTRPFSVGWYAVDEKGVLYRIAEYYGCTGTPNEGLQIDPTAIAAKIREIEKSHPLLKGKKIMGVADPSIFDKSRGESVAQMMAHHPFYLTWNPGDNTRLAGKMQFHYRLAFDAEGRSMFYCFRTCPHFIRTIPNLVYDTANVEDIDTDQEDHIYDECRYVFMSKPITPPKRAEQKIPADDPLDLYRDFRDKYKYYR